jgi:hypothetical protein
VLAFTGVAFFTAPAGFDEAVDLAGVVPAFLIAPGFGAASDDVFFTGAAVETLFFFAGAVADLVLGAGNAFFGVPPSIFFLGGAVLLVVVNVLEALVVAGA